MSSGILGVLLANRTAFLDFVASRVESRAVAEDLLQEALARSIEASKELREADAAVGWFYQVLRNAIIDHHRRKASASKALDRYAGEMPTEVVPEPPRKTCK